MSADNWATCPRCKARHDEKTTAARKVAEEAYGKVPVQEYALLLTKVREPFKDDSRLREDYEIGIRKGKFLVSYRGACEECKFVFRYEHEEGVS